MFHACSVRRSQSHLAARESPCTCVHMRTHCIRCHLFFSNPIWLCVTQKSAPSRRPPSPPVDRILSKSTISNPNVSVEGTMRAGTMSLASDSQSPFDYDPRSRAFSGAQVATTKILPAARSVEANPNQAPLLSAALEQLLVCGVGTSW